MTPRARSPFLVEIVLVGLIWSACGESRLNTPPPLPDLAGTEAAVVDKIHRAHADVVSSATVLAWTSYARALHAHEMTSEALEVYEVAIAHAQMPEKFDLLYLAGYACLKGNPDRAISFFEEALELRDDYEPLHLRLAGLYEQARRFDDARRRYKRAHQINPSSFSLAGLGRIGLAEGRVDEAIAHLEKARAISPNHPEVHVALADAYTRAGRKREAAAAAASVGNIEREHAIPDPIALAMHREGVSFAILEQFGNLALGQKDFGRALAEFDRALAARPDNSAVLVSRAQALMGLNRFAEAEPILDRVLTRNPEDVRALTFRAGCSMERKDLPGAVSFLRRAIGIDSRSVLARWTLARILIELQQLAEAKQHLFAVLGIRPTRTDARFMLAVILADEGKTAEAMAELEIVLAQDPAHGDALALRERLSRH